MTDRDRTPLIGHAEERAEADIVAGVTPHSERRVRFGSRRAVTYVDALERLQHDLDRMLRKAESTGQADDESLRSFRLERSALRWAVGELSAMNNTAKEALKEESDVK